MTAALDVSLAGVPWVEKSRFFGAMGRILIRLA
jgi:hypothetical protein